MPFSCRPIHNRPPQAVDSGAEPRHYRHLFRCGEGPARRGFIQVAQSPAPGSSGRPAASGSRRSGASAAEVGSASATAYGAYAHKRRSAYNASQITYPEVRAGIPGSLGDAPAVVRRLLLSFGAYRNLQARTASEIRQPYRRLAERVEHELQSSFKLWIVTVPVILR